MTATQIMICLVVGSAAIAIGLSKGLAQGIERIRDELSFFEPKPFWSRPREVPRRRLPGQIWFAAAGAVLLALAILSLFTY